MATKRTYVVKFQRKREGKTDYRARMRLLSGQVPRLVVRRSLSHVWAQIVNTDNGQDKVLVSGHSSELAKKGYKGCLNNIPACYLVGYLLGKKALAAKLKRACLDVGMLSTTKGAKIFAVARGAIDAGLVVPLDSAIVPDETRLKGQHIAAWAAKLQTDKDLYAKQFGHYLKKGLRPEDLPKHIEEVKKAIA